MIGVSRHAHSINPSSFVPPNMKYRYLGNSGLLVSRLCLGTMTFGMKGWGCDESTAAQITKRFVDAGGNFIDTADMYSSGTSE
jgi:1-deoxyxylulose-5-phosphate synthase